jgi:peptide-methionine (S)-S-oxide reductase
MRVRAMPAAWLCAGVVLLLAAARPVRAQIPNPPLVLPESGPTRTAVLAGGCFWGMEGVFEQLKGVKEVLSGYSGGSGATAHYELVSTGTTGHAESVQITYDPSQISYGTLLKVFFAVAHDPTELDYQGPDHGTQYRSVIFYSGQDQRRMAEAYIRELDRDKVFRKPIVTQLTPLTVFYPAEEYHQHFMEKNPDYPYIVMWDQPKLALLKREFPALVR